MERVKQTSTAVDWNMSTSSKIIAAAQFLSGISAAVAERHQAPSDAPRAVNILGTVANTAVPPRAGQDIAAADGDIAVTAANATSSFRMS